MAIFDAFRIRDRRSCQNAIRNGGIAAMIGASVNAIFAWLSSTGFSDERVTRFLNPWMLVDAALVLILGLFVFRKSRIAATTLFLYFVVVKVRQIHLDALPIGHIAGIIFFGSFYFNAMRATYIWHTSYKT